MNIKLAYGDDWQCLYVENEAYIQGHHIGAEEVIMLINKRLPITEKIEYSEHPVDIDWLEEVAGHFPKNFEDVVVG